jgi:Ohr subfamily peroxiredoxin
MGASLLAVSTMRRTTTLNKDHFPTGEFPRLEYPALSRNLDLLPCAAIADAFVRRSPGQTRQRNNKSKTITMKTLFTAEAISEGGRSGSIHTPDHLLDLKLGNPLEKGAEKRGPSPELLFAGAYSACFNGALGNAAKKLGTPKTESTVRALVSLVENDDGGYRLAVELHAQMPGVERAQVQRIMEEAHQTCPYSKALRGHNSVTLLVD